MKAINKAQVIDLMDKIQRDGVDNTHYSVDTFVSSVNPAKWYGCEDFCISTLQPGAYCALWIDDTECSNMPTVGKWIDQRLSDENILLMDADKGWCVLICLDLL